MTGVSTKIGKAIRNDLSKVMRDVMLLAADNVVNSTPVKSGHAGSNWVLSVRAPHQGIEGSPKAVSWEAQKAGIRKIENYDIGRDGPRIYLRNNVLYVQFLDKGWSQQAPANFVALAIMAAQRRATTGRKAAVQKMLRQMTRAAYIKSY